MNYTPIHLTEEELINRLEPEIGKVKLSYRHYGGKDLYSDGTIEDELLSIVKNKSRVEFPSVIDEAKSWPILYHLSELRANIVDFLPIRKTDRVLEIGSGCGAITDKLSEMGGSVTCVDLSEKRSRINAYRNQDRDNIEIHVGNFSEIEPDLPADFDWICLIGVFEYASSYIGSERPYEDFLKIIKRHLAKDGHLVVAIENRFGLKYFAGAAEDHVGTFYSSIEGYPEGGSARTFTRNGLEKLLKSAGIDRYRFYYPYPDYKLPHLVFSDDRLPGKGELTENIRNFDRNRMLTFREDLVFDEVLEEGAFPLFSNSYLVITGEEIPVIYAKYSNDRRRERAIRTTIELRNGEKEVRKTPSCPEAGSHIREISDYCARLTEKYEGSPFRVNACRIEEKDGIPEAVLEYVPGITLEEILDDCLKRGDKERFREYFRRYFELVSYGCGEKGPKITDYDLIFSNILIRGDEWTIIDYEWVMDERIDPKQVAFRGLYCYLLADEKRNALDAEDLLSGIGISPKEAEEYRERELEFQHEVTSHHKALGELLSDMGTYAIDVKELFRERLTKILDQRIQLYYDEGTGFSEENSRYLPDVYSDDVRIDTKIAFDGNVRALRIDPADRRCLVRITELMLNGQDIRGLKRNLSINGVRIGQDLLVFDTEDPNIGIDLKGLPVKGENELVLKLELYPLSAETARELSGSGKRFFR
ncbi:MAG: class I SAM-dependent methyltransferase [Lachnospiraceae bacterium]|nr:class I SAM-dependent methyltransferase [Lachnospiraceae bacterium]